MDALMKYLLSLFIFGIFSFAYAEEEEVAAPPPLDPAFEGQYEMAIVNIESRLYATLLNGYKSPRNYQLVYRLDVDTLSIISLVRDSDIVTLKTSRFNLQRLIRGEKGVEITAGVYLGDIREGAPESFKNELITFTKLIYVKEMKELTPSNSHQVYEVAEVRSDERLLIHQIQSPPSYAHLILQASSINCIREFNTSSAVPSEFEVYQKLAFCGSLKPLYYDAKHYQK